MTRRVAKSTDAHLKAVMQHHLHAHEGNEYDHQPPVTWIIPGSLFLAALFAGLPLFKCDWFDARWCAALSSAWLNVLAIALAVRFTSLSDSRARPPAAWPRNLQIGKRAFWTQCAAALSAVPRAIRWQPWLVLASAASSVTMASAALHPVIRLTGSTTLPSSRVALIASMAAFALAFAALVAERFYSMHAVRGRVWISLANMLRAAIFSTLLAAVFAALLAYVGLDAAWPVRAIAAFNAAIALELGLRIVLSWFTPPSTRAGDASVPDSFVASMLRWHPSPLARVSAELRQHYGIDLRQNWVLHSVVRLLPGAALIIGICGWLLTGVVIVGPGQRAVYERFGAPIAVWQPGLHAALPWPFGRSRMIDNGAVHQLVVSGSLDQSVDAFPPIPADAQTPEQLNRLWDIAHQGETTQVIAGANGDKQNFQVVSADVRVDYRVGLSDAAARASLYRTGDISSIVRAIANREVVNYLASHTLESLLETRQTLMADSVMRALQARLDRMSAGVDVVALVIESVHPPAGAAAAWHNVQAAQIRAQASVSEAQGTAARLVGDARQQAHSAIAEANAQAADIASAAGVAQITFRADMAAAQAGGGAFVLEYYLHNLQKGLENAHVTVIDNRLVDGNRATIDLRSFDAADAAGAKRVY